MIETEITKLSSKGQLVIPQTIREHLGLKEGELFAIAGEKDTIVLKKLNAPSAR